MIGMSDEPFDKLLRRANAGEAEAQYALAKKLHYAQDVNRRLEQSIIQARQSIETVWVSRIIARTTTR